jgi:CheY-like chemotaxis protein
MAYGFAKQSGGHLHIQSAVGRGTKVSLYLPRAHEQAERPVEQVTMPATEPGELTGTETVLLVDDNQSLMAITARNMRALGYKVVPAKDAKSALELLAFGAAVDLLFTDIVMPGEMNGPDLAHAAHQLRPGLRILFTTGYAEMSAGDPDQHLLRKPYGRRGLATALRAVLDGSNTRA